MSTHWQQFMTRQGAALNPSGCAEFFTNCPFPDLESPLLIDLQHYSTLELAGPDCIKFLQGQITQDAQKLAANDGFFTDHCNPKGRILASFFALGVAENRIRLLLPSNNAEHLAQHLNKYLVFSKATLSIEPQLVSLAVNGGHASQHLAAVGLKLPSSVGSVCSTGDTSIFRYSEQCLVITSTESDAQELWQALAKNHTAAGARTWRTLALQQGVLWVDADRRERYTPHQINHQFIDAINFRKGCYTGQEVVARMHYKATLKSHCYLFNLTSDVAPKVFSPLMAGDQKAGEILQIEAISEDQWLIFAEVRDAFLNDPLHIDGIATENLHQVALPYAINK